MTYPNHTSLDRICHPVSTHDVFGEHCGAETILRIVCLLNSLLLCLERLNDNERSEDLFLYDLDVILVGCEDGWFDEVALFGDSRLCASMDKLCAIGFGGVNV